MIATTSLELSKKLCETFPEWKDAEYFWTIGDEWDKTGEPPHVVSNIEADWAHQEAGNGLREGKICQAFDFAYLWEKLPTSYGFATLELTKSGGNISVGHVSIGYWDRSQGITFRTNPLAVEGVSLTEAAGELCLWMKKLDIL